MVPGFIAEWIEEAKNKQGYNVVGAVNNAPSGDVENWLILENVDIFTKAWVYGYEVESEKEYVIKLKNSPQILLYEEKDEEYYFAEHCGIFSRESHTRKEQKRTVLGGYFIVKVLKSRRWNRWLSLSKWNLLISVARNIES